MLLTDVCLSVVYIGRNSRTERPRKTKIGTEVAHVTRALDTTFKIKRSKVKGQGHQAALLTAALTPGSCSGEPENVLRVGNCCYISVCSAALRRPHKERGGAYRGGRLSRSESYAHMGN